MAQMPKEVRDILDDPHYLGVAPPKSLLSRAKALSQLPVSSYQGSLTLKYYTLLVLYGLSLEQQEKTHSTKWAALFGKDQSMMKPLLRQLKDSWVRFAGGDPACGPTAFFDHIRKAEKFHPGVEAFNVFLLRFPPFQDAQEVLERHLMSEVPQLKSAAIREYQYSVMVEGVLRKPNPNLKPFMDNLIENGHFESVQGDLDPELIARYLKSEPKLLDKLLSCRCNPMVVEQMAIHISQTKVAYSMFQGWMDSQLADQSTVRAVIGRFINKLTVLQILDETAITFSRGQQVKEFQVLCAYDPSLASRCLTQCLKRTGELFDSLRMLSSEIRTQHSMVRLGFNKIGEWFAFGLESYGADLVVSGQQFVKTLPQLKAAAKIYFDPSQCYFKRLGEFSVSAYGVLSRLQVVTEAEYPLLADLHKMAHPFFRNKCFLAGFYVSESDILDHILNQPTSRALHTRVDYFGPDRFSIHDVLEGWKEAHGRKAMTLCKALTCVPEVYGHAYFDPAWPKLTLEERRAYLNLRLPQAKPPVPGYQLINSQVSAMMDYLNTQHPGLAKTLSPLFEKIKPALVTESLEHVSALQAAREKLLEAIKPVRAELEREIVQMTTTQAAQKASRSQLEARYDSERRKCEERATAIQEKFVKDTLNLSPTIIEKKTVLSYPDGDCPFVMEIWTTTTQEVPNPEYLKHVETLKQALASLPSLTDMERAIQAHQSEDQTLQHRREQLKFLDGVMQ